jgi:hypothetical protein
MSMIWCCDLTSTPSDIRSGVRSHHSKGWMGIGWDCLAHNGASLPFCSARHSERGTRDITIALPCDTAFFIAAADFLGRFFFAVSNVRAGVEYKLNIINLAKQDSLYCDGLRPLVHSRFLAGADMSCSGSSSSSGSGNGWQGRNGNGTGAGVAMATAAQSLQQQQLTPPSGSGNRMGWHRAGARIAYYANGIKSGRSRR